MSKARKKKAPSGKARSKTKPKAKAKAKARSKVTARSSSAIKTVVTNVSVADYVAAVPNDTRRADANTVLKLMSDITGWKPRMWGPSIIGFGSYHYTYDSGHSATMCALAFSPRSSSLVVYVAEFPGRNLLLKQLGKHKESKACLYINKLADVDQEVLRSVLERSLQRVREQWPVSAS